MCVWLGISLMSMAWPNTDTPPAKLTAVSVNVVVVVLVFVVVPVLVVVTVEAVSPPITHVPPDAWPEVSPTIRTV